MNASLLLSLNSYVPWTTLLEALGCEVRTAALPAKAACPLCSDGQIVIFPDPLTRGQWYWCSRCRKSGDMLDLAMAAWKLPLRAAVAKLLTCGVHIPNVQDVIRSHLRSYGDRRQRVDALWEAIQANPSHQSTNALMLLQRLRLRYEIPESRWASTCGQVVGVLHKSRVEELLHPDSVLRDRPQPRDSGCVRLFRGSGWEEVAIIPWRALPGLVMGYTLIGRQGGAKDIVHYTGMTGATGAAEAGLVIHPELLESPPPCLLLTDNLIEGLRMQLRHFQVSSRPYPVAVWTDQRDRCTGKIWHIFSKTKLVFWAPEITPSIWAQAISADGWVSQVGPSRNGVTPEQLSRYIQEERGADFFRFVSKSAEPWALALSRTIHDMTDESAEELMLLLRDKGIQLPEIIQRCRPIIRTRLQRLFDYSTNFRSIFMSGQGVEEKRQCWFRVNGAKEELISDAILRIVKVVHHPRQKRTLYQGLVLYRGERIPFTEDKVIVDKDPLAWMQDLLIQHGKGVLRCSPPWSRRIVAIALQFNPADLVTGMDTVGWSEAQEAFLLPQFKLDNQGKAEPHDSQLFLADAPGSQIPPPQPIAAADLQPLVDGDRNVRLVWSLLGHLLSTILGPACRQRRPGLALVGPAARCVAEQLADVLGLPVTDVSSREDMGAALRQAELHHWPYVLSGAVPLRAVLQSDWALRDTDRDCVMMADWPSAALLLLNGGWHMIEADWPPHVPTQVWKKLPVVFSAYLQDVCQRQLHIPPVGESFLEDVMADLASWLDRCGLPSEVCREALAEIYQDSPRQQVAIFGDLLCRLIDQKKLAFDPAGFESQGLGIEETARHFQVPKALFAVLYPPAVDTDRISVALAKEHLLVGEDQQKWWVDRDWWLSHLRQWRALSGGRLKIHG